jgi:D-3-phosphoglycerate dehydrogenase
LTSARAGSILRLVKRSYHFRALARKQESVVKIVITEFIWSGALDLLRQTGEVVQADDLWRRPEALRAQAADADALIVRNQTQVTRALLTGAARLQVVGRLGVGLDNVDLAAARERGVPVVFARAANATTVAEYVCAALFTVARQLTAATASVRAGQWNRQAFTGIELAGRTLGIVGIGDIGARIARRAQAFGMAILACDPQVTTNTFAVAEFGVTLVDLETLLARSDFVTLHVPLLPETRSLLNAARLAQMRPDAWLINTARGGVIDETALHAALVAGRLAGAVLDVRVQEPPPAGDPLAALPNVILTPHIAGLSAEAGVRTAWAVADDVLRVLRGEPPRSPVA